MSYWGRECPQCYVCYIKMFRYEKKKIWLVQNVNHLHLVTNHVKMGNKTVEVTANLLAVEEFQIKLEFCFQFYALKF